MVRKQTVKQPLIRKRKIWPALISEAAAAAAAAAEQSSDSRTLRNPEDDDRDGSMKCKMRSLKEITVWSQIKQHYCWKYGKLKGSGATITCTGGKSAG